MIHAGSDGVCGEPRITAELARGEVVVNHKRIARLMRSHQIVGVHKPAKVRTTIPAEDSAPMPDLIGRNFTGTGSPAEPMPAEQSSRGSTVTTG
jgi:hypothetical protein